MLKHLYILGFALAAITAPTAPAKAVTIEDIQRMKVNAQAGAFGARAESIALSYYIQGAMEAIALAQQSLEKADKPPLFCPPKNSQTSADEIYTFLDKAARTGQTGEILPAILNDFKARYPCKARR
jgi:hypothetical protein